MTRNELRKLIREEIQTSLQEADVIPFGPDGRKIEDPAVIRNLNYALKAVDSTIRRKLIELITDPTTVKLLKTPAQKTAVIGAMAIAFGITEDDFSRIVAKIKSVLKKSETSGFKPK